MNTPDPARFLIRKDEREQLAEIRQVHQFNPRAERFVRSVSDPAGMQALGLHFVRLEPGSESTEHHVHQRDDEFVLILTGALTAHIDEATLSVTAGDLLVYPAGGPAHSLVNDSDAPATYLVGGNSHDFDICDYPRKALRMYRVDGQREYAERANLHRVVKKSEPV